MKKLLLLLSIVFVTITGYGQATGYALPNFASSGSIGTAATTVDVYSRININQTTPSITLTVPPPTNTSTKVVEVWIGNKGTVSFTLRVLPDVDGFVLDTGQAVILKWVGAKYVVIGKGGTGGGSVTSVSGTTNRITSTGGSTPVIDISSSYVGQSSITTVGTIGTGTWNAGSVTSSGAVTGLNFQATGSGGLGYLRLAFQTTAPTAVSGSMILYADGSNRFSIVRRNNANSADITRTHLYPDGSYDWTFPTPASGSSSTLAGLNTAQTFSSVNTFSATGGTNIYLLDIFDVASGTYKPAIEAPSGNQLRINGMGSGTGILLNTSTSVNGIVFANSFNAVSGGGNTTTGNTSLGMIVTSNTRSTASALKTDFSIVSGNHTGAVSGANTQNVSYITGSQTNASGTGATTGSHLFAIGTIAGTGTRGGVSFFNGTTTAVNATEPAWNSGQQIIFIGNRTASPTVNATNGTYFYSNSGNLETTGSFVFPLAGTGLQFKTGTNARVGTSTLSSGTITVANTSVTANTKVKVQLFSVNGGTLGAHYLYTVNPGVGFTITSVNTSGGTHTGDTAIVDWYLTEFN